MKDQTTSGVTVSHASHQPPAAGHVASRTAVRCGWATTSATREGARVLAEHHTTRHGVTHVVSVGQVTR
jgi:hypothetical protein